MTRWVLLADPGAYGWAELERDGRAVWDGIGNAVAQKNIRSMQPGDLALIYETAPSKALRGIGRVATAPYPDPGVEGRTVVDVEPVRALARPLPLDQIKADEVLAGMSFVRMPRVAVQPLTDEQWQRALEKSGT